MHIAILTFDGYNELDSLIALGMLNRVSSPTGGCRSPAPAAGPFDERRGHRVACRAR